MSELEDTSERLPANLDERVAKLEDYLAERGAQSSDRCRTGVVIHLAPWFWTFMGALLGLAAVAVWG